MIIWYDFRTAIQIILYIRTFFKFNENRLFQCWCSDQVWGTIIYLLLKRADLRQGINGSFTFSRCLNEIIRVQGSKLRGGWICKIAGGPPKFWVLLHFYVTISKFSQFWRVEGGDYKGSEGGHTPPLPPFGHVWAPWGSFLKIFQFFQL